MLFRDSCASCGQPGVSPCQPCVSQILQAGDLPPRVWIDGVEVRGGLWYSGPGRRLISGLKYGNRRGALDWLADQMLVALGGALANDGLAGDGSTEPSPSITFDAITWVPSSRQGRRQRGFDTGRLLAECLASSLSVPALPTLRRGRDGRQSNRSRDERIAAGPAVAPMRSRARVDVSGRRLLLVDDVCTTGASITRSRCLLLDAGAHDVTVVVAAVTPSLYDGSRYAQVCG